MSTLDSGSGDPTAGVPYALAPSGYRLPATLTLGPVRLQVGDLNRSIAYYEGVLGLQVQERGPAAATLVARGDDTVLIDLRERVGATPVPRRGRLGLYHFALLLPDRAALGRFVAHLASLGERAGSADHLVSEALYLTDPDGLGIEVYADRPRSTWQTHGGALAMATDPLDVEGLIGAGGGQPWTGAPAGTRVGHIHLYVDDLRLAGAFYHDALGLDRIALDFPGALFMSAGGYHHHLGTNTWAAGAPKAAEGDARLLEWGIRLPVREDVERAARSLGAAGYAVTREGSDALAADPWGTTVRLAV